MINDLMAQYQHLQTIVLPFNMLTEMKTMF